MYFFLQTIQKLLISCVQALNKMQSYWERNYISRIQDNSNFRKSPINYNGDKAFLTRTTILSNNY